jgi:hypothetical protein
MNTLADSLESLRVGELLTAYPGLKLVPTAGSEMRLVGNVSFSADAIGLERIDDAYEVEIRIPLASVRLLPVVRETGGRIPQDFHHYDNGALCLGSPAQLRLTLAEDPSILGFIQKCLIPYLYGFSYRAKHGAMPFGELEHGAKGILKDFADLFEVQTAHAAYEMVRLAGMKKRVANKSVCPCGNGVRLGKCHNRQVNRLRTQLGRLWFREQARWLKSSTDEKTT